MKRLLLLRHAQALPAEDGSDIDRKLSPKGLSDALALGRTLRRDGLIPERILCSAALRTRQTCEKLLEGLGHEVHADFAQNIYSASVGDLFKMVQITPGHIETFLMIGHNPAIYELAAKLASDGPETVLNHLGLGYPPTSLSVIESDIVDWGDLDPNTCRVTALYDPLDFNAPATPARWT